jgi:hypothetical protein
VKGRPDEIPLVSLTELALTRRVIELAESVYTRQRYVLDVIAGILLACVAYVVFLRKYPRESIPEIDRRVAPALAAGVVGILGLVAACFWVAYRLGWGT